jgi:nucleolar complex protein 2
LKKNDASLLDFGGDGDDSDVEDDDLDMEGDDLEDIVDSDQEEEDDHKKSSKKNNKNKANKQLSQSIVTEDQVRHLMKAAMDGSLTAMKKTLTIFRAACNPMTEKEETEADDRVDYTIDSPELYEFIMTHTISHAYTAFYRYLGIVDISAINSESIQKHPKWKNVQLLMLSYFKSVLHTLSSLADSVGHGHVAVLLISSLEHYIPLIGSLPRLAKKLMKVLLTFWSKDLSSADESFDMRGHALLRIRQMAMRLPGTIAEECFRSIYLSYARSCKSFTEASAASVLFMAQSIVELYLCDPALAYQQSFLHIRQLALMTRIAILKKTSESVRQITNWQFLNCLRLWTRMICALPGADELGALAFPLSQIIFGVMSMASSLYYAPLRYHLITCIHQLVASCRLYIPVAMKLFEILESSELYAKATPSTNLAPSFVYLVKLVSESIDTAVVRDVIVQQALVLIRQDIELYRYNAGFPEYAYLIARKLKQSSKKCKIAKWRDQMKPLISQVDNFLDFAKEKRLTLGLPPAQIVDFESLLPKNTPDMKIRLMKLLTNTGHLNAMSEVPAQTPVPNTSTSQSHAQAGKKKSSMKQQQVEADEEDEIDELPAKKKKKRAKAKKSNGMEGSLPLSEIDHLEDELGELNWMDEE